MIDVLVYDWQPLALDGAARVVRQDRDLRLVAETGDAGAALQAIRRLRPAVALVAGDGRGERPERLLAALERGDLPTRVVLLDADPRQATWERLGEGAAGILSRRVSADAIRTAVRCAAAGGIALCEEAQDTVAREIRARRPRDKPLLSPREREVLELVAEGRSAPDIARRLHVARTTVRTHLQHLYDKLEAGDRAQLVRNAMRRNLID